MMKKKQWVVVARSLISVLAGIIFLCQCCSAQLCTGSLGDPVVNITFGAGPNFGAPLAAATTNYQYIASSCPPDGSYTVASSNIGCSSDTWHTMTADHTGNPNGYYMLVNASFETGDFYVDTVRGLCGNTTYEFASWITNMLKPNTFCGPDGIMPNITFSIEKLNGSVIQTYNTGDIHTTEDITWKQYGFFFTTQPNLNEVIIRMRNNAPGGCGNDLALDDITFRPCGPMISISILNNAENHVRFCIAGNNTQQVVLKGLLLNGFDDPAYQWEVSRDSGTSWQDVNGENTSTLNIALNNATVPGAYLYRLAIAESSNIGSAPCRIVSNTDTVIVGITPDPVIVSNSPLCAGSDLSLTVSGGTAFAWSGPNNFSSLKDTVIINGVTAANAGKYVVSAASPQGCSVTDSTVVSVTTVLAHAGKDTAICQGSSVQLTAGGGGTYSWLPASTLSASGIANPLATPADTTAYTVTVTQNGCSATDTIIVNVVKKLTASGNSPVCAGSDIVLSAINGNVYQWNGPNGFTATGPQVKITAAATANAGNYFVADATAGVCPGKDSVKMVVTDPATNAGRDTSVCAGTSVTLSGSGNGTSAWSPANGLSAIDILNPVALPTTTTSYVLSITQNNCIKNDTVIVTVFNKITVTNTGTVCAGNTLTITAANGNAYVWSGPGGFSATGASINIFSALINNAGRYFVKDTTNKVCNDIDSVDVVIADPHAHAGSDTTVCEGNKIQLNGSGNGAFTWQPSTGLSSVNIAAPSFTASQSVQYILIVTQQGCTGKDTVSITVNKAAKANAGSDKTIIEGQSVVLNGSVSNASSFFWSPGSFMDNPNGLLPVVKPPADITYTLHAVSANGCGNAADDVTVKVIKQIVIPNTFSPNGDGIHDVWMIESLASYTEADVSVFNRYGQIVFHSTGYNKPWDGTYNSNPVPVATYYYTINLKNNTPVLSGWVVVLR